MITWKFIVREFLEIFWVVFFMEGFFGIAAYFQNQPLIIPMTLYILTLGMSSYFCGELIDLYVGENYPIMRKICWNWQLFHDENCWEFGYTRKK